MNKNSTTSERISRFLNEKITPRDFFHFKGGKSSGTINALIEENIIVKKGEGNLSADNLRNMAIHALKNHEIYFGERMVKLYFTVDPENDGVYATLTESDGREIPIPASSTSLLYASALRYLALIYFIYDHQNQRKPNPIFDD